MKYSVALKFVAVLLAALMVVAVAGSIVGITVLGGQNLYANDLNRQINQYLKDRAEKLADSVIARYTLSTHGNCPGEIQEKIDTYWYLDSDTPAWSNLAADSWCYSLATTDGVVLEASHMDLYNARVFKFTGSARYPVMLTEEEDIDATYGTDYYSEKQYNLGYGNDPITIRYYDGPEFVVTVSIRPDALTSYYGISPELLQVFYNARYVFIWVLGAGTLLFAVLAVLLCCIAGKTEKTAPVQPAGLNRLPLDLYGLILALAALILLPITQKVVSSWLYNHQSFNLALVVLSAFIVFVLAVLAVGFVYAVAAQVKQPGAKWWKDSLLYQCGKRLSALVQLLPAIWQWLVIGIGAVLLVTAGALVWHFAKTPWLLMAAIAALILLVGYCAYALGVLLTGAKRMSQGELEYKIPTKLLFGGFARWGNYLNALADTAMVAARKQVQADRMKTELITNVSHDIKTPLTSVINYVDLLQQPHTQDQGQQYLEVLGRQSLRLKKLIEDLMEMSKASTGNMNVNIASIDAVETMTQALGEFADKLERQELSVVFRHPQEEVTMQADGRLAWRVISNLLSNIVKYAMPGTRVYVDLTRAEGRVQISFKNISREPLNVSAEELTERFVRGDASRNSEGSGLGLNIAKSLMELQKGSLELLVDGDLFKATLDFLC